MGTDYELRTVLVEGCAQLGIALDTTMIERFFRYLDELLEWNARFNLTAITGARDIVIKHFLDSLTPLSRFPIVPGAAVVDIGTGAGFPGLPIKIVRPDIELTLLDSSQKKIRFVAHVAHALDLEGTTATAERAEDFARHPERREHYDLALSRAVADLAVLVEYALPLLKVGGRFLSYKAKGVEDEVDAAARAVNLLGGCIEEVADVVVPFLNAERYIVSVGKVAPTPPEYPRRAGIPGKKPLL